MYLWKRLSSSGSKSLAFFLSIGWGSFGVSEFSREGISNGGADQFLENRLISPHLLVYTRFYETHR
jgi:hypothetical protein